MSDDDPLEVDAIERARRGDAAAYDYLVAKYLRRAVSIAWGVVRNAQDAEDLAQEAFVKAYQNIGRFRSGEPFGPWIFRIVTNAALDLQKHRKRYRHEELPDDLAAARRDDTDLPALADELGRRIDTAIEALPAMQRLVARLHLVEHLGHDDIATITGLAGGTVRSHLSLARKKLKEQLADLYGDHDEH